MATMNEQAFFELLCDIQEHSKTLVCNASVDPNKIVNVDLNKREIEILKSAYGSFLSIRKEHYAETVYFKMPRYYDGVDLMTMALVIEYVNAKGNSYVSPVLIRDTTTFPGYILFGWNIHGNATEASGNVQFAIRAFQIDLSNHNITYSLRTKPATGKILYGVKGQVGDPNAEEGFLNNYALDEVIASIAEHTTLVWDNL